MKALYLITDGTFTKIGTTENPESTKELLQNGNGYQLSFIFYKQFESQEETKRKLHSLFKSVRFMRGWFKLSEAEIELAIDIISKEVVNTTKIGKPSC